MAERRDELPGDLPLFSSGCGAQEWDFAPGDEFWQQVARIGRESALSEQLDAAMVGKSAPRVWLILHEPGQPELSTAVALAFAQELGGRSQAALVLDCDEQCQSLTGWAERLESEGWIDLARYGTSVLTSGVPMPFDGRRGYLLGVGSFAPTDVTATEIEQMVKRLRRQADDLILVAPADGIGKLWAAAAGIRLLCWDRATRTATDIEGLVTSFAAAGHPLTGLVGFGLPMATAAGAGEKVTAASTDQPAEQVESEVEVDADSVADDFETPAATRDESSPDGSDISQAEEASDTVAEAEPTDIDQLQEPGWREAPALVSEAGKRKGTSGVFWFLTIAAVVIVGIMSAYWFQYGRVAESDAPPAMELADGSGPGSRISVDRAAGELANQDGSSSGAISSGIDGPDVVETETIAAVADTLRPDQGAADPLASGAVAPAESVAVAAPAEPRFSMAPYRDKVGSGGWALHLYSFPGTTGAQAESAELQRQGFETEIRVIETLKKGRWWRVYVGSFASRDDARTAAPLLKKKLRTDWANPTRF